MNPLIDLSAYPVNVVLENLLTDKTTKDNIIFATSSYKDVSGDPIDYKAKMTKDLVVGFLPYTIQPRVFKAQEDQSNRTRELAEVFTPSWLCNKMNNYADQEWFGKSNIFNYEKGKEWEETTDLITFPDGKTWQDYVQDIRLEITCGEAPFLVSRYDAATGDLIPVEKRIGLLDRKLRVVNENTDEFESWYLWTQKAYQSIYGYEYQGDNLLIARINLLLTFVDNMHFKWKRDPSNDEIRKITNIIVWNLWQMDGLTGTVPLYELEDEFEQFSLFEQEESSDSEAPPCRIYDWKANKSITYNSLKEKR